MKETFDPVSHLDHIWVCPLVGGERLLRVEEHTGAETHTSVVALQDVIIFATLATLPEFLIVGQFGESHWLVAHS